MSAIPTGIILPDTAGDTHPVAADYPQKGTILVYGLDGRPHQLPVGTAGQVLTVDAGETLGLKWADNAA